MAGRLAAVLDLPAVVLVAERAATGEGDATPSATSSESAELCCLSCGKTDFVTVIARKARPDTTTEKASNKLAATRRIRVPSGARSNRSTLEIGVTADGKAGRMPPSGRAGTPPIDAVSSHERGIGKPIQTSWQSSEDRSQRLGQIGNRVGR